MAQAIKRFRQRPRFDLPARNAHLEFNKQIGVLI